MPRGIPTLNLENQYGEVSENVMLGAGDEVYSGAGSYQVVPADLPLDADAGSAADDNPKFLAAVMGNIIGDGLSKDANYLAGVIGAYSITGTKVTKYPSGGLLGIIMDGVTEVDGCVVAHIDGDSAVTKAGAAFKAKMTNSNSGSGVDYGLDLYDAAFGSYIPLAILKADLRLSNQVCMFSGATAPVDGTTGDNFAGPGSIYIARDTGKMYLQASAITTPVWKIVTSAA